MIDILIQNTTVVTMNLRREILYNCAIAIEHDRIIDIGNTKQIEEKYPDVSTVISGKDKVVFPGFINTHNHLFQALLKGLGDDKILPDWLRDVIYPCSSHLTTEDCYLGAMVGSIEGIHSGVTTQLDYMYPHPVAELSDGVIQAFKELGIRGILGRGYINTGEQFGIKPEIMQNTEEIKHDVHRLVSKYNNSSEGRIQVWLAPQAIYSNTEESLKMTKELAEDLGLKISIHISETPFSRAASQKVHGMPDIDVAEKIGIMGPNLLMVHCVYLTPRDIRMTKVYDAKVSYNPLSNMYLSSGVAPIPEFNLAGISVGLGTDGAASNNSNDMIELLKAGALLQKVHHKDPTIITSEKMLEMATIEGARTIGMDREIGSLEPGKKADLFIFNPSLDMKAIPMHHPVSTLVYSSSNGNIETVVIDGRIVLENGKLTNIDESLIAMNAQKSAIDLCVRAGIKSSKERLWRSIAY